MNKFNRCVLIVVLACPSSVFGAPNPPPATDLPAELRNALGEFKELKSLSMTYRRVWSTGQEAGEPKSFLRPEGNYLKWQGRKMYLGNVKGEVEWKDSPNSVRQEYAIDGHVLAVGNPNHQFGGKPMSPQIQLSLPKHENPKADFWGAIDLETPGIRLPHGIGELLQDRQVGSQVLFVLEDGGTLQSIGTAQIDGRMMTRIEILANNPDWSPVSQNKEDDKKLADFLRAITEKSDAEIQKDIAAAGRRAELKPRQLRYVYYLGPTRRYAVCRVQQLMTDGGLRTQS